MKYIITLITIIISINLYAGLPNDLQLIKSRFDRLVEKDESGDFEFSLIAYKGTGNLAVNILKEVEEIKQNHMDGDFNTVEQLEVYTPGTKFQAGRILDDFIQYINQPHAFYCFNYQNINYDREDSQEVCAANNKTLLDGVFETADNEGLDTYIVDVEGNFWGDYKEIHLYIISKDNPNYAIKLLFDIQHEL